MLNFSYLYLALMMLAGLRILWVAKEAIPFRAVSQPDLVMFAVLLAMALTFRVFAALPQ